MARLIICICSVFLLFLTNDNDLTVKSQYTSYIKTDVKKNLNLSAMEALDLVKKKYAANFEKVYYEDTEDNQGKSTGKKQYYYKLPDEEYYLAYEGQGETKRDYLIHLYEFVLDDPDTGIGHAYSYGWYSVNKRTGKITDETL